MAENKDNIKSEGSGLPPIGSSIKNVVPQASGIIKGSFQLDDKGKDKLPNKDWIHWALIVIPVLLLVSIVVILYAFYIKKEEPGPLPSNQSQDIVSPYVRPSSLPEVIKEADQQTIANFLSSKTSAWDDSL